MPKKDYLKLLEEGPIAWAEGRHADEEVNLKQTGNLSLEINLEGANLRGRELRGFDFFGINFRGADLRACDLSDSDLSATDLSGTRLTEAKLESVKFFESDMSKADLGKAFITDCAFGEATLAGASLGGADIEVSKFLGTELSNTNFHGALVIGTEFQPRFFSGADFTHVRMASCVFLNTDFRGVKGLSSVVHGGPSSVAIETLFLSEGKIPKKFLLGCGVPSHFVEQIPKLLKRRGHFYSCFISHSSKDKTFCDYLYRALSRQGVRLWYYPEDAKWGRGSWNEITRATQKFDKMIVVCSRFSLRSGPVLREIERALAREDKSGKEVLFPIRLDDYIFKGWEHARKADVTQKVIGDFLDWQNPVKLRSSVKKLIENLESDSKTRMKRETYDRSEFGPLFSLNNRWVRARRGKLVKEILTTARPEM